MLQRLRGGVRNDLDHSHTSIRQNSARNACRWRPLCLLHAQLSLDSDKLGIPLEDLYIEVTAGILTTTNNEESKFAAIPVTIYPYLPGKEGATRGRLCYDDSMKRDKSDDEKYSRVREELRETLKKCAEELRDEQSFPH